MKKLHKKQKQWLLAKSEAAIRKLQKKNKCRRNHQHNRISNNKNYSIRKYEKQIRGKDVRRKVVPSVFSITNNTNETLNFFNEVYDLIKNLKFKESLFFDFSNVEDVTVDAIMYLIALLMNTNRITIMQIRCFGNVPQNENAKKVIETSGFYNYVSPNYKIKYFDGSNINISSGYKADPVLVGNICDFVHKNSVLNRLDTKSLFPMIMELMTNTKQHAYGNDDSIKSKWYVFVDNGDNKIQFVFLDTGKGIPSTIRANFLEKIKKLIHNSDAYFIASALRGEFRTETKLGYRGKGLPEIYNRISEKEISDFSIVSCQGKCDVDMDGNIIETKLLNELKGTLFCWKLDKQIKGE